MKSIFLLSKIMLLLCLLVGSVNGAWGGTITFSKLNLENGVQYSDPFDGGDFTVTFAGGGNDGKYYTTGTGIRVYGGGTMTIAAKTGNIASIEITYDGSNKPTSDYVVNGGTYDSKNGKWTGNANTVVFTRPSGSGHWRVQSITVTLASSKKSIVTIGDLGVQTLNFNVEGKFAPSITPADGITASDYTISWDEIDNSQILLLSDGSYVVGSTTGVVDVTVTVTPSLSKSENYQEVSKTFTVTIVDPNAPGTENNPYTVAQARAAIDAGTGLTDVYAKGIVSQVDGYNSTYKSITYWISDDGTTTNQLEVYSGKGIGGADFSSEDDVQVGDEVVVKGTLKKYNSTYEFDKNNQLVSLKRTTKTDPELAFAVTSVNVNLGDAFVAPVLTNPHDVTVAYSSDDTNVATVDPSTGEVTILAKGEATITASFAGDETYKVGSASYTITVIDPNEKGTVTNPYTVAEVIAMAPTSTSVTDAGADDVFVKGYIVGSYNTSSKFTTKSTEFQASNLALADAYNETDGAKVIPVQVAKDSHVQKAFDVTKKTYNVGVAQVLIKGDVLKYFGVPGLKNTLADSKKIAEKIDITAAGMATYYTDCALDFTGLTDMYAYIVTEDGGSNYSLTRVNKVPAETGLLLYNPNGGAASNVVPVLTDDPENVDDNKLTGTLEKTTADANFYILNNGTEGVGFYKGNGQDIDMHRAYLTSTDDARPFFLINFDSEATGISFVGREASMNNRFFNLKGQQVKTPQKGLYIVNGKKVIVK